MTEPSRDPMLNNSDKERPETTSLIHEPPMHSNPSPFETNDVKMIDTSHIKRDALEKIHLAAYAVGHFSNDLCAAGWFFYLSYYLKFVLGFTGENAGLVILAGQIADGCTTPLVGLLSDRIKTRIGSRAPFYILGSFVVLPCFLFLFLSPFTIDASKPIPGNVLAYYISLASIFNIGWASTQIANMSVVNTLTFSTQKRDQLVASRNTFTFVANIFVLLSALLLFIVLDSKIQQFRILAIIIVVIGFFASVFYTFTIKEPYLVKEAKKLQKEFKMQQKALYQAEESEKERVKSMSMAVKQWHTWFKEG
jgi:Na+/melibiose symporter-like transporter